MDKQSILSELKDIWLILHILGFVVFAAIITTNPIFIAKIAGVFFLFVTYGAYLLKGKFENLRQKALSIFSFILMLFSGFSYLAAFTPESYLAIYLLLAAFLIELIGMTYAYCLFLLESKNIWSISLFYSVIAILGIVLFCSLFVIVGISEGNGLRFSNDNARVMDFREILFFAASVFYGNALGNILPVGYSKLLMIVELAISFVFHSIIIGHVINSIPYKTERQSDKKVKVTF